MSTKPEQLMWDYLDDTMRGRWDAQRHEDKFSESVPDVSFACRGVDGWLELKVLPSWPKQPGVNVRMSHLRPGQVNWMEIRGKRGRGAVWLLLAVGTSNGLADWVLIHHTRVRDLYEAKLTREDLLTMPCCKSPGLAEMLLDAFSWYK